MIGGGVAPDVAILVPVLRRPHRVAPLLDSIQESTPAGRARVLFLGSPGDAAEHLAVEEARAELMICDPLAPGDYARKINLAIRRTAEPLLFLGADDLRFHPGWLEAAEALLSETVGVVGTNDLCNPRVMRGEHATHFLVARWYADLGTVDEEGKLLHEGYAHEYVDNELIATARSRGAYAHAADSRVEHLHPIARRAPVDALYAAAPARLRQGRALFKEREALWA